MVYLFIIYYMVYIHIDCRTNHMRMIFLKSYVHILRIFYLSYTITHVHRTLNFDCEYLWMERIEISKIGKVSDQVQPLARWVKKLVSFGPLTRKL